MVTPTPGPWEVGEIDGRPVVGPKGESPFFTIAYISGADGKNRAANARLIAAAPDLLAACKRALPFLADLVARTCGDAREFGGSVADRLAFDALEAAIAKAEPSDPFKTIKHPAPPVQEGDLP